MARLTIFEMMNQGLVGSVRRLIGMGAGLSEILADLSIKFFGQAPLTISRGANFALRVTQAGERVNNEGEIASSAIPRLSGLPSAYRFIVRVSIDCIDAEGKTTTTYATVYRDSNTNLSALEAGNSAMTHQMRLWFSGMGFRSLEDENVCGAPSFEIIGVIKRR